MHSLQVLGHRGYSAKYPENTMLSMRMAVEGTFGAAGLELDIYATADDEVILHHDHDLSRMTDGEGLISERNWRGYIEGLKTKGGDGEGVARLHQLFQYLKEKIEDLPVKGFRVLIDVKEDQPIKVLRLLKDILDEYNDLLERIKVFVGTWTEEFAIEARRLFPHGSVIKCVWIGENWTSEIINSDLYDGFNGSLDEARLAIIQECRRVRGKEEEEDGAIIFVWTVNGRQEVDLARALEVDVIIGDDPLWCLQQVQ